MSWSLTAFLSCPFLNMRLAGSSSQIAALHLTATLHALAEVNPGFAEILETAAIDIQQRSQLRVTEARDLVLYAIKHRYCWTVRDLVQETGFSEDKVRRALRDLVAVRKLYIVAAPVAAQRGGNRKLKFYLPADQTWEALPTKTQESKIKK